MSLAGMHSPKAIVCAIEEYNRGPKRFLEDHHFKPARRYFLDHGGQLYPSKAIVGVAHGYEFPDEGPLKSDGFKGGKPVKRKLEELGFQVRVLPRQGIAHR